MSTSPSWFDQEKFSRLVKKVGPKSAAPAPEPAQPSTPPPLPPPVKAVQPAQSQPEESEAEVPTESLASTARISLVSKPPSLVNEHRALPALPRRTAPLPGLKSLFGGAPKPEAPASEPNLSPVTNPAATQSIPKTEEIASEAPPVKEEPIRAPEAKAPDSKPPTGELPKLEPPKPEAPKPDTGKLALPKPDTGKLPKPDTGKLPKPDTSKLPKVEPPKLDLPKIEPEEPEPEVVPDFDSEQMDAIWHKMSLLNEELAQAIQERDQALIDANILRDQLQASDDALEGNKDDATKEEFARLIRERDDALAQAAELRTKVTLPSAPPSFGKPQDDISKTKEVVLLATERDQARKEYAELRKKFEALKTEASTQSIPAVPAKEESMKFRKELEQQLDGFRQKLEERNKEIAALKAGGATASAGGGNGGGASSEELASVKEQLTKAKEEASVAQRGLALSQKALHETRDTLREATEGSSLSRHNFDNLKSECAALSQQNTVLQAQNDQLARELAAAKSKLTTRS